MKLTWYQEGLPPCAQCGHPYSSHRVGVLMLCYRCNGCFKYVCPCKSKRCKYFLKNGEPRVLKTG